MQQQKVGVWLIGAWGGVSTTAAVGLAALQQAAADGRPLQQAGLVSALPQFAGLGLVDWNQLVIGGHEIRPLSYAETAEALHEESRVFKAAELSAIRSGLESFDANIVPGTLINVGPTIERLAVAGRRNGGAGDFQVPLKESPAEAIERIGEDIASFREREGLERVVVVNLASTEPAMDLSDVPTSWAELSNRLRMSNETPLPASTIYAVAAMQAGCAYVNFTPSVGSNLPAVEELAEREGVLHVGRDGKTGETLMKSVLAPMFAARNLKVLSWVGHNIFGNMDAVVLDDPVNKAAKARSKDHLLTEILGYKPQTLVSIEYIQSMADWKTAWDHIHFEGFLGTKMSLQFTWQGCDSLLAAPLVLDLVRFTEREQRRGASGIMRHLSSFFKSPAGENVPPEFARQYALLEAWAAKVAAET